MLIYTKIMGTEDIMAISKKTMPQSLTLYNKINENDGVARYQTTYFKNVRIENRTEHENESLSQRSS